MNKIAGLRTVAFKVPDLEKAKAWYSRAFSQEPYFDEPFYVGFRIDGFELGLLPSEGEKLVAGNTVTAYWAVDDVEATMQQLVDLGATRYEEPQDVGGNVVLGSVRDPWNNIIGLIYNPHFKAGD